MKTRITVISVAALAAALALPLATSVGTRGADATQGQAVLAGLDNSEGRYTSVFAAGQSAQSCSTGAGDGFVACGSSGVVGRGTGFAGVGGIGGPIGVFGTGDATGVDGYGATGVHGQGSENGVLANGGTFGVFADGNDYGVYGRGPNHGVYGEATTTAGAGVEAVASAGGTALRVTGKARFNRSGTITISSAASKTVTLAGVTTASMVLATAQQNGSVAVKAAVPGNGSFTIYLTGTAPSTGLKIAYFVLN